MRLPNFSNKPKKLISYRYLLFLNDHGIISDMINVIEQLKPFQLKKIDISSSNFVRVVPPRLWRKLMHEEMEMTSRTYQRKISSCSIYFRYLQRHFMTTCELLLFIESFIQRLDTILHVSNFDFSFWNLIIKIFCLNYFTIQWIRLSSRMYDCIIRNERISREILIRKHGIVAYKYRRLI